MVQVLFVCKVKMPKVAGLKEFLFTTVLGSIFFLLLDFRTVNVIINDLLLT